MRAAAMTSAKSTSIMEVGNTFQGCRATESQFEKADFECPLHVDVNVFDNKTRLGRLGLGRRVIKSKDFC